MPTSHPRFRRLLLGLALATCFAAAVPCESAAQAPAPRIATRDLATIIDMDGLSVSPDGRWAAFQTRRADPEANSYDLAWLVVETSGGSPRRVGIGGEPMLYARALPRTANGPITATSPAWSPDSRWIAYLRKDLGRTQVWRSRVDGRRTEQITHGAGDVDFAVFSGDGTRLFFTTRLSQVQFDAALAEEGRSGFHFDERFGPVYSLNPLAPSGASLDYSGRDYSGSAGGGVQVYDLAERQERHATAAEMSEYTRLTVAVHPPGRENVRGQTAESDGGALAWTEARDPALQGMLPPLTIVAQPAGTAAPIVCEAAVCTSQHIWGLWWRNDSELLFARPSAAGLYELDLYAWRPGARVDPRRVLRTRGMFVPRDACAVPATDKLVCTYEEPARPRRLISVDLNTGEVATLYDPNPNWSRFDLGREPEVVVVSTESAVETFGYLSLPPDYRPGQRLPLIIVTYSCGGFQRGGTGDEYPIFPFAAQGFAVFCYYVPVVDFARAAQMDAAAYQRWDRGAGDPGRRRVQEGLNAIVAELDRREIVDPRRVGLTGLSYGADVTKYALFNMPSLTVAIASGTPLEPSHFFMAIRFGREAMRGWGLDSNADSRWAALSLSRNADRVRAPVLLHVSDRELLEAIEPVVSLQEAGRAVDMYVFPNEYHIKWQPAHRLAIYQRNVEWMNYWLRGVEGSDLSDGPQYARWRILRENQCRILRESSPPWYCDAAQD